MKVPYVKRPLQGGAWLAAIWILNLKQEIVICVPQKNPMTIEQLGQVLKT